MKTLSKFYAPPHKPFVDGSTKDRQNHNYVLEILGDAIRHYYQDGYCSEWSSKGNESYEYLIKRAIETQVYTEIPFPHNFCSRSLVIEEFESAPETKAVLTIC